MLLLSQRTLATPDLLAKPLANKGRERLSREGDKIKFVLFFKFKIRHCRAGREEDGETLSSLQVLGSSWSCFVVLALGSTRTALQYFYCI